MNRFETLKNLITDKRVFKLVCGAGNEDIEEVRRLTIIYTIAGASILDLSANKDVVKAAKEGIETAYELATQMGKSINIRPYLNVSIGLKGDPHVRKAIIDYNKCTKCGACISVCRQEAITGDVTIKEYRCIGCGDCQQACELYAINFFHKKADFIKILPECVLEGTETMELHAVAADDEDFQNEWRLLNNIIKDNYLSLCIDRNILSNQRLIERVKFAYEITKERLIIQADGVPMSGEGDDFNTTLQAVACADIINKSGIPVKILLSGGTNSKTGILAKQCGVNGHGVAVGSWARKIVKKYVKNERFYDKLAIIKKAVLVAEKLIKENVEALSGKIINK